MKEKIKVAFIYKGSNPFLSGKNFDNGYYNFFMKALKRNERIDISYFPAKKNFDTRILKNKFDIILLFGNQPWDSPNEIGRASCRERV